MTADSDNSEDLTRLYREVIKAHAADPVGYRRIIEATHRHEAYNPLCGDRIEIAMRVQRDRIEASAFDGEACAICMASASLLCSMTPGQDIPGFSQMCVALCCALLQEQHSTNVEPEIPQELHPLLGVRPYPSRVRCATLPWDAALKALAD